MSKETNINVKEKAKAPIKHVSKSLVLTNEIFMFAFLLILVGVITDSFISRADLSINLTMVAIQGTFFTAISKVIDVLFGVWSMTAISIIITLILYFKDSKNKELKNKEQNKNSKKNALFFAITLAATEIIITLLKLLMHRARPTNAIISTSDFAFPSGHTTFAVVFFGLIAYLLFDKIKKEEKKRKERFAVVVTVFSLLVLLIGFSRIYLNIHWLTDILAGLFLGGFLLTAAIIFRKKYAKE